MRKLLLYTSKVIGAFGLVVATMNANSVCIYLIHQPQLPEKVKSLRKF